MCLGASQRPRAGTGSEESRRRTGAWDTQTPRPPTDRVGAERTQTLLGREACNLGGPLPFTSPHPAWLFIATSSPRTHLPMFRGQTSAKADPPPPTHTHSETEGRQHSGQAPGASLPESGLPRPRVAPPRQTGAPQGRRRPQRRQQPSQASTGVAGRRGPQKGPDHPTAPPCSGKTNSCTFK